MITVVSPQDPKSYAEFDCFLDAEIYYEVARESLPRYMGLVMMNTEGELCVTCKQPCSVKRQFTGSAN
jgi:hypothetical protein